MPSVHDTVREALDHFTELDKTDALKDRPRRKWLNEQIDKKFGIWQKKKGEVKKAPLPEEQQQQRVAGEDGRRRLMKNWLSHNNDDEQ